MTVQQLIDLLEEVDNKGKEIFFQTENEIEEAISGVQEYEMQVTLY